VVIMLICYDNNPTVSIKLSSNSTACAGMLVKNDTIINNFKSLFVMPKLDWIGKSAVEKHHQDVPYRLLEPVPALSYSVQPKHWNVQQPSAL